MKSLLAALSGGALLLTGAAPPGDASPVATPNLKAPSMAAVTLAPAPTSSNSAVYPPITAIIPPNQGFYTKKLDYHGIPIMSSAEVSDAALYAAYDRLSMELKNIPQAADNLARAGAQLHIIGKDQVTSDLPEWRGLKGKKLPAYNGLTVDQRTRGLGGLWTSCGEENLLKLDDDRYKGRDICIHEFAHNIRDFGMSNDVRGMFDKQYKSALAKGLWIGSYAASNPNEFFAELSMWYFGTHGDLYMTGAKPANGPEGLKAYDPDSYALFDSFYGGRIRIEKVTHFPHHH